MHRRCLTIFWANAREETHMEPEHWWVPFSKGPQFQVSCGIPIVSLEFFRFGSLRPVLVLPGPPVPWGGEWRSQKTSNNLSLTTPNRGPWGWLPGGSVWGGSPDWQSHDTAVLVSVGFQPSSDTPRVPGESSA